MLLRLLASLIIGALAGAIANKIMNGDPKCFFHNALLGIVGGVVGGFLGGLLLAQLNREFRCGMRNRSRQGTKPQEYWGRSARKTIRWIVFSGGRA
ncbi:MAG: hypothetical protein IKH30_09960, partial [Clostridia bacterium]|nr:hypothetical protein [Clostridia bacterium]